MIEDELIKIWQSSSNQERIKFEKSKLMIELQASIERLHRWWNFMENVNVISASITIPLFVVIAIWAPYTSVKISSVLVIFWAFYVGVRMSVVKKIKPVGLEDNYLQYLKKTKSYLLAQKKVVETSLNWRILTIYPIYLLFFVSLWKIPIARYIAVVSFFTLVGVGVYEFYQSKRRVRNEINPRIARVDELIKELQL